MVSHLELLGSAEGTTVQVRAVRRAHVLDVHERAAREDPGVRGRREGVVDLDVGRLRPPERRAVPDGELGPRLVPHRRHDLSRGSMPERRSFRAGRRPLPSGGRASSAAPALGHGRGPERCGRPTEEQVQDAEEAELQQEATGIVHARCAPPPRRRARIPPKVTSSPGSSAAASTRRPFAFARSSSRGPRRPSPPLPPQLRVPARDVGVVEDHVAVREAPPDARARSTRLSSATREECSSPRGAASRAAGARSGE